MNQNLEKFHESERINKLSLNHATGWYFKPIAPREVHAA